MYKCINNISRITDINMNTCWLVCMDLTLTHRVMHTYSLGSSSSHIGSLAWSESWLDGKNARYRLRLRLAGLGSLPRCNWGFHGRDGVCKPDGRTEGSLITWCSYTDICSEIKSHGFSPHLALVWLFLATASLALMGSGSFAGIGEFYNSKQIFSFY